MEEKDQETLLKTAALAHPQAVMYPYNAIIEKNGPAGFDAVYALSQQVGGLTIYVPNARRIFAECLEQEVIKYFTGQNYIALSHRFGYTERHIRRIVEQNYSF